MGTVTPVLLDTHVLLWAIAAPHRLSEEVRRLIESPASQVAVSAASAWEIGMKFRLGKLPQAEGLIQGYPRHLDRLGVSRLDITEEHALLAGTLAWGHRDPFDRLLAAQSLLESMSLLTVDPVFATLSGLQTIW